MQKKIYKFLESLCDLNNKRTDHHLTVRDFLITTKRLIVAFEPINADVETKTTI